eukprot:GSChrysophyteH1.ASY1.ANO1.3332.1 assembled CDS
MPLEYIPGFGNHVSTEAIPGALPLGQNTPQVCPLGLYAEQLSGTAFTASRHRNLRSWLYRIRPSVVHSEFSGPVEHDEMNDEDSCDFVDGLKAVAGAGDCGLKEGCCIYNYLCNRNMVSNDGKSGRVMCNADGDLLIVPQQGSLLVITELGKLEVKPCEIVVIPRGIKFSINVDCDLSTYARGYALEVYQGHFELPSLVQKYMGKLFSATMEHSPFDVVAWHGNYYPFKYDLNKFCTVNAVRFDNLDPSIFTVLTVPTHEPGVAVADFVIFPKRWMVAENTFRPPFYHRNCMSEYMGMIHGIYDAKAEGFVPGGSSLHSCMSPHGPDAATFDKASKAELKPDFFDGGLAFMFESCYMLKVSSLALYGQHKQENYNECWRDMKKNFKAA